MLLMVVAMFRELNVMEFELRVQTADVTLAPLRVTEQPVRVLSWKAEV